MNSNQISINHHYVPQFIIKKFYSEQDKLLYSFDVKAKKVNTKRYSSKKVCLEKHAHTLSVNGEKIVEIENYYSDLETKIAELLRKIEDNENSFISNEIPIDFIEKELPEFYKMLAFFLSFSFWRLPINKRLANSKRKKIKKIYNSYERYGNDFEL